MNSRPDFTPLRSKLRRQKSGEMREEFWRSPPRLAWVDRRSSKPETTGNFLWSQVSGINHPPYLLVFFQFSRCDHRNIVKVKTNSCGKGNPSFWKPNHLNGIGRKVDLCCWLLMRQEISFGLYSAESDQELHQRAFQMKKDERLDEYKSWSSWLVQFRWAEFNCFRSVQMKLKDIHPKG